MTAARRLIGATRCERCAAEQARLAVEFEARADGVFFAGTRICGPLRVAERRRYRDAANWREEGAAVVVEFVPLFGGWLADDGETFVRAVIPLRDLLGDGAPALRRLADGGLWLAPDAACDALVVAYLRRAAAALP